MLYIHFFRNVIEKPQINKFKIFRKCFVLPGAGVTPTDRPKSVRNLCVIEVFVAFLCVVSLGFFLDFFVIRLSQIPSFFSYNPMHNYLR